MYHIILFFIMVIIMTVSAKADSTPLRIWCLGDSITKGDTNRASYRKDLFFLLKEAGLNFDFVGTRNNQNTSYPQWTDQDHDGWGSHTSGNILNGGYTGTSDESFSGVTSVVDSINPDVVLLHIGTNDYNLPVATSMSNISGIISTIRNNNPNVIFFVANMVPIGKTQFQEANQALASAITTGIESYSTPLSPVYLVDMRTGYNMNWFTDSVHPDSHGEAFMADKWANSILLNIPEPATIALLLASSGSLLRRNRKIL
jgi:lysophospholipase L1-like esterase